MAIYHCNVKIISRSQGRSATGAAAYRSGEKITDERSGLVHDYTRKGNIDHTEILAPENAPSWVHDRSTLWNEVEHSEKRKDSQLCREVEVALPVELTLDENLELVRGFIKDQFVKKGMVADFAVHHAKDENPHAHILLTTREISPDGFGKKQRDWNHKDVLELWRMSWETHANKALEASGHDARINHRTLEAQGIERLPQIHVGPKVFEMEARGIKTERGARAVEIDETNQKITSLQEYKEALEHECNLEIEKRQNSERTRERDRTNGPSTGDTGRSNNRASEPATAHEPRTQRELDTSTDTDFTGVDRSRRQTEGRGASTDGFEQHHREHGKRSTTQTDHDQSDHFDGAYSGALERILDLARPTDRDKGRGHMAGNSDKQLDRTYLAVKRQLQAMGAKLYEIGVKTTKGMLKREWSIDQILKSVPWLKRENAKGADIYVRPAGDKNQGIILVDDINHGSLERMKSSGFEPASVVETSPQNFQVWVRVSKEPLAPELATGISKGIAKHFDADLNSADWRHFGRLAGFTNRKPEHKTAQGRNPWVLCHESSGRQASRGDDMVQTILKKIIEQQAQSEKETRLKHALNASQEPKKRDPIRTYQSNLKSLTARYGADMDLSRADFMICSTMACQGFTPKQLVETLEQASPELPTRKAGHESDYCQRTVKAVFDQPEIQKHVVMASSQRHSKGYSR